jgi:hypothetical protein
MVLPLSVCMSFRLLQSGHVDVSNGRTSSLLGSSAGSGKHSRT